MRLRGSALTSALRLVSLLGLSSLLAGCGETLPDDVADYRERCLKMTSEPIPKTDDDPHEGEKDVFACNLSCAEVNERPFPDGTLIVKESTRSDSDFPWLVATARKEGGSWQWDEYTRNFENEDFVRILPGEDVCIDCHKKWESQDWIVTYLDNEAECPVRPLRTIGRAPF